MDNFYELTPDAQAERLRVASGEVLPLWGIEQAELKLIKYRENAVFEATHAAGRHALRVHRQGYHSDAALRSELQWMGALADAGIHTPTVVSTASGDLFATHVVAGIPGPVQIDLFEWVDGAQLGSVEDGLAEGVSVGQTYLTIGELAAQVHNQAENWALPEGFTRHAWDAEGLAGSNPFWGRFWELEVATPEQTLLLQRLRDRVFKDLSALPRTAATYGLIHADFVPENLMVEGDQIRLIDFDDAGFGWHLFELATSLYFLHREPDYEQAKAALVRGYRRNRAMGDEQLALLPMLEIARSTTYLGWVHTRSETETAQELAPMLLEWTCDLADNYL